MNSNIITCVCESGHVCGICVRSLGRVCGTGWSSIRGWVCASCASPSNHMIPMPGRGFLVTNRCTNPRTCGVVPYKLLLLISVEICCSDLVVFQLHETQKTDPNRLTAQSKWSPDGVYATHPPHQRPPPVPSSPLLPSSPPLLPPSQTSACLLSPHGAILLDNKPQ